MPSVFSFTSPRKVNRGVEALKNFNRRQHHQKQQQEGIDRQDAAAALLQLATGSESTCTNQNEIDAEYGIAVQTELSGKSIQKIESEVNVLKSQCEALTKEVESLNSKLDSISLSEESFKLDHNKMKCFTGLPNYAVFSSCLDIISPFLIDSKLSKFEQFLLSLMRIKMNVSIKYLAYQFSVHYSTITRVFNNVLDVCYVRLVPLLVVWPEMEAVKLSMPLSFKKNYPRCISIIDCFEIFHNRPSSLDARAKTYSNYKSHNTLKYLISISPQGVITFISKGYGGRASDQFVTEDSGFLQNLLPNDLVLADRGFDIHESVGFYGANLKIPNFTKGKTQLSSSEIECTRKLASSRIHVERVIGDLRQKYDMLRCIVPISLLQYDPDLNVTTMDKIVHLACGLTNLTESIVPFN